MLVQGLAPRRPRPGHRRPERRPFAGSVATRSTVALSCCLICSELGVSAATQVADGSHAPTSVLLPSHARRARRCTSHTTSSETPDDSLDGYQVAVALPLTAYRQSVSPPDRCTARTAGGGLQSLPSSSRNRSRRRQHPRVAPWGAVTTLLRRRRVVGPVALLVCTDSWGSPHKHSDTSHDTSVLPSYWKCQSVTI
jgi:hypothetical protein